MDMSDLLSLRPALETFAHELAGAFRTRNSRTHFVTMMAGQIGPLQRKSVEPIALEFDVPVRTLQEFFSIHRWCQKTMMSDLRSIMVRDHYCSVAIGVIDETSFPKKGRKTAGVSRQYCGQLGKIDNCLQTVHLAYVTPTFSSIATSDLYVPKSWIDDEDRCRKAGIPKNLAFRTKIQMATDAIKTALGEKLPLRWITADEFYGRSSGFRRAVNQLGLGYVVEVPVNLQVRLAETPEQKPEIAKEFAEKLQAEWATFQVKETTKGPMLIKARAVRVLVSNQAKEGTLWLIMTEDLQSGEKKYFLSNASECTPLEEMLIVAFNRWRVERCFQDGKQEVGMGHFEVRSYTGILRHLAVSMASLMFLSREKARLREKKTNRGRSNK